MAKDRYIRYRRKSKVCERTTLWETAVLWKALEINEMHGLFSFCSPFVLLYKVEEGLPGWSEKHRTALKQALRVRVFVAEEHTQKKDTLFSHIVIILH